MPLTPDIDEPAVLGLDNVRLDLPLAGIGSRILAASIDHFFAFLLQALCATAGTVVLAQLGLSSGWVAALIGIAFFLVQWGYFAAFEIANGGQTPGKVAVGLRVVSRQGGQTTPAAILMRNFIRTFDILIGVPVMAIDRRWRRVGDMVAGTLVVHHRDDHDAAVRLGRHPESWGAREVAVAESLLRRSAQLDEDAAERLSGRLLTWIAENDPAFWAEAHGDQPSPVDNVPHLRRVLAVEES